MAAKLDFYTPPRLASRENIFADVKVSRAQSLQSLTEVRNLSKNISERIQSATSLISDQGKDIRRHLHMVKETTARYCELQKRLELAARLMDDSYQQPAPSLASQLENRSLHRLLPLYYSPRKISLAASVLSVSPIKEDTEQYGPGMASPSARRAESCGDVRCEQVLSDGANSNFHGTPKSRLGGSSSDLDSGVALEGVLDRPQITLVPTAVASWRPKGAELARIATREEIVARYLEKQRQRQMQPPHRPCSVALDKLESSLRHTRKKVRPASCHVPPHAEGDDDAASDAASRWSSVSNSRGSRRITAQSFESDFDTDVSLPKSSRLFDFHATAHSSSQVTFAPEESWRYESSIQCEPSDGICSNELSSSRTLPSPMQNDSTLKWFSMPNLLSDDDGDTAQLDKIFNPKLVRRKCKTTLRRRGGSQSASGGEIFIIRDGNRKVLLQKEKAKYWPTKSRGWLGFLRRKSKCKDKDSISKPMEAYAVSRQVTFRQDSDSLYQIELYKPANGPYGFSLQRGFKQYRQGVFIRKLAGSNSRKFLSGLLKEGDEIIRINDHLLKSITMQEISTLLEQSERLLLTVLPYSGRDKDPGEHR